MSRNLFETLNFNSINNSVSVIDLTDELDESDDDDDFDGKILTFPDSFSSDVGKLLNDQSISAVLSNVEIFYKSQLEFLSDNRYDDNHGTTDFIDLEETADESIDLIDDLNIINKVDNSLNNDDNIIKDDKKSSLSSKQSFSSYYFLKQTFNCPVVLIDHLIDSLLSITVKDDDDDDNFGQSMEYPQQIEIDSGLESYKSTNIVTKKDLRLIAHYEAPPIVKRAKISVGRPPKKFKKRQVNPVDIEVKLDNDRENIAVRNNNQIEVIDLIDSGDDEMTEVNHLSDDNSELCES